MINLDSIVFPALETPRLLLREILVSDVEEIFFLRSDPGVMRYIDRVRANTLQDALTFIEINRNLFAKNDGICWAIQPRGSQKIVGTIGFWRWEKENYRAEIGYALHPSFHQKGYMSEALQTAARYGFEKMHLHSILANINPGNDASRKLLLRTGFKKEAYFRENYYFNGKFLDSEIYVLLSTDIITVR